LQLFGEADDDFALRFADSGCPSAPFALPPSLGPVFTDGSAFDTGMSFPAAAFAIVQEWIRSSGMERVRLPLLCV